MLASAASISESVSRDGRGAARIAGAIDLSLGEGSLKQVALPVKQQQQEPQVQTRRRHGPRLPYEQRAEAPVTRATRVTGRMHGSRRARGLDQRDLLRDLVVVAALGTGRVRD